MRFLSTDVSSYHQRSPEKCLQVAEKRKKEVYGIITTEIPSILTIFLIDVRTPGYRGQGNAETDRDLTRGEVYATLLMELKMRQ